MAMTGGVQVGFEHSYPLYGVCTRVLVQYGIQRKESEEWKLSANRIDCYESLSHKPIIIAMDSVVAG